MQKRSRASAPKKHVILFLAANPHDTGRMALDREARSIQLELKRSGHRERFEFVTRWAVEPLDLLRELRELKPTVVHFSGHGAPQAAMVAPAQGHEVVLEDALHGSESMGLVVVGANGRSQVVTAQAIAQTLHAVDAPVRLVVLNACYSASIAEALLACVDCVVGMTDVIHDDAARSFAIGFYGGLGEHESIAAAFKLDQWRRTTGFDTVSLYDVSGIARVQGSPATNRNRNLGKDYSWRDYFRGARRLGEAGLRAGYISRPLFSESEKMWVFGIAAPIYDQGAWAGVLLITVGTDAVLGQQRLDRATDDGPMAVIVAPRDRSRATTDGEGDYVVILHDGLTHGAGIAVDSSQLRALRETRTETNQLRWNVPDPITDDDHRDPVPGFEGRWLAGFAPVGGTGFVVIVQTRYDAALQPNTRLSRRLAWRGSAVILVWLAACAIFLWGVVRRRRTRTTGTAPRRAS